MLKYLCLIVLVSQVYGAPVVDETDTVNSQDDQVISDVVNEDFSVQDDGQKIRATKSPKVVEILESSSDHQLDGSYSFHYRGADGSFREESAIVKNPGTEEEHLEISGAYSFFDADGKEVVVHYKADERGFVPVGNNIHDSISLAARENSQLPAVKQDDDEDVDDSDLNVLQKKEGN